MLFLIAYCPVMYNRRFAQAVWAKIGFVRPFLGNRISRTITGTS